MGRPAFSRRDLLPAPRYPLRLCFGEQNLHTVPAPQAAPSGNFRGAVCSPLRPSPCGSVSGSKIFTQFPRRRLPPERLFQGAVCSPLPAIPCSSVPGSKIFTHFPRRLLPTADFFRGTVCSPLPAIPCSSVSGSKIFTQFPRRLLPRPAISGARFAPRSPLTLAAPFRGAKSSHNFRAGAQKSTLSVYRQGAFLSPAVPPRGSVVARGSSLQFSRRAHTASHGSLSNNSPARPRDLAGMFSFN